MQGGSGDDWLLGVVVDGRYAVDRVLGRGAMGVVYLAHHRDLDRWVALKVLRPDLSNDERLVERFRREARTASSIGHPNIIHVYDFGRLPDGSAYLVMEHFDGEPLADVLTREGRMPISRALGIGLQVCDALGAAHERGVVHRDVKPDNVLLGVRDVAKVLDFGIAKIDGRKEQITRTNEMVGTPLYMAPEQWRGIGVDPRTDVYAFGAVLFEMICGRTPFLPESLNALIFQHLSEPPPRADAINPNVPRELATVIDACLAKSPSERPQSMRALANALGRIHVDATEDLGFVATMLTPVQHVVLDANPTEAIVVPTPPLGSAVGPIPPAVVPEARRTGTSGIGRLLALATLVGTGALLVSAVVVYAVLRMVVSGDPEPSTPVEVVPIPSIDASAPRPDAGQPPDAARPVDAGRDGGHHRRRDAGASMTTDMGRPHMEERPHHPDIFDPFAQ